MRKITTLLFFCFFFFSFFAQKEQLGQVIRGEIFEKNTLQAIEFVSVVVEADGKQFIAQTDSLGRFFIPSVPVGRCKIWVGILGYFNYVNTNLVHLSKKETVLSIALEENVTSLQEFVVKSGLNKREALNKMAGVSARLLSVEEANRYAGSLGDPARMVANLAGVVAANDTRNDIIIRANSPYGVLWRLDGFEISNPNHFGSSGGTGGPVGMINSNQLTNSDFYTGAFPAQFGNATAGVFDLRLRKGNNSKHEFLTAVGFNGFELGAEGPFSKTRKASYMVNARYSFLKILNSISRTLDVLNGAIPEYRDLNFKLDFPLKKGNLSLLGLAGVSSIDYKDDMKDSKLSERGDKGREVVMRNVQGFVGLNYTRRLGRNTRLENRISFQCFNTLIDQFTVEYETAVRDVFYKVKSKENRYTISSILYHRFNAKDNLVAGVGASIINPNLKEQAAFNTDQKLKKLSDGEIFSTLYSGHVQWQHAFNDKLRLSPGIYAQYYDFTSDYSIEPRFGLKWKSSEKLTFNIGAGMLSQIQPRQLLMFINKQGDFLNRHVKMNRSAQFVTGVEFSLSKTLYLKSEIYYQYLYNIPLPLNQMEESSVNLGDNFYNNWHSIFTNEGTGRNQGVELTLEKFFDKHYYFLITASLFDSKYTALDSVERNTKFNGNFAFNTLFGYEWDIGKNMQLSVNGKIAYLGAKRFVPLSISSDKPGEARFDYKQAYTQRLPDYFKIDLNLAVKQNYKQLSFEWFLEIANLTNHKNVLSRTYNPKKKKDVYMYQMSFMPIGGVKIYL